MKSLCKLYLLLGIVIVSLVQCRGNETSDKKTAVGLQLEQQQEDTVVKGNFQPVSSIVFDSSEISGFLVKYPEFKSFQKDLYKFYKERQFSYAWFDQQGVIEATGSLVNNMQHEVDSPVPFVIPYDSVFKQMLQIDESGSGNSLEAPNPSVELMLTAQYFNYAQKVWKGVAADKTTDIGWFVPKKKLDYVKLLEEAVKGKSLDELKELALQKQYFALQSHLPKYKELAEKENLKSISTIPKEKKLKPGDTSFRVSLVRGRLNFLGYTKQGGEDIKYENELIEAVNLFKKTHGLKSDSAINNDMIAALNVPAKKRLEQLLVNMERMRWIPTDTDSAEYIIVNIPEFKLHYYKDRKEVWSCNVVVGTNMTKTVIFSGEMSRVVFSPYWYIPNSIIQKEVVPGMKRNANYLKSHNMEWNGGNVRQKPGPTNSLGLVKFIFPNSNSIYLHDTPSKSLFSKNSRAFSHGCVRVAEPRELAIIIMKQDTSWTPQKIDEAMHASVEKSVSLKKKIPVHIGYFTAFVDKDGQLNFCNDVYKRDDRLKGMIM